MEIKWFVWQPVEAAPKDGSFILMWGPQWQSPQVMRWAQVKSRSVKAFVSEAGYVKAYLPTHWMPLADPPK
jgi:hypothetical protein